MDGAALGALVADARNAGNSTVLAGSVTGGQQGMATDFDRFVKELQRQVTEEARAVYSDRVVKEFSNPKNLGRLAESDAYGTVRGWCGDTMEIYLRLNGKKIEEASFMTDGCGPTVTCESILTTMVQGMSLKEAKRIRPEHLIDALDGLPVESVHCAELAVSTLQEAIGSRSNVKDGTSGRRSI